MVSRQCQMVTERCKTTSEMCQGGVRWSQEDVRWSQESVRWYQEDVLKVSSYARNMFNDIWKVSGLRKVSYGAGKVSGRC